MARAISAVATLGACLGACAAPFVAPQAAWAQQAGARDRARADSLQRAQRSGLIPAGFGSLRKDDIALVVQSLGLTVKAIPLDENVIRTLAPDSYRPLHALRETKSKELEAIRSRTGLPSVQAWYVLYANLEQGEARYDQADFLVRSAGRDFRPLRVLPINPRFGDGRLVQRATADAIYVFDPAIDLDQPITVTIGTQQSTAWSDVLLRIERERSLVWSRAAAGKP